MTTKLRMRRYPLTAEREAVRTARLQLVCAKGAFRTAKGEAKRARQAAKFARWNVPGGTAWHRGRR